MITDTIIRCSTFRIYANAESKEKKLRKIASVILITRYCHRFATHKSSLTMGMRLFMRNSYFSFVAELETKVQLAFKGFRLFFRFVFSARTFFLFRPNESNLVKNLLLVTNS